MNTDFLVLWEREICDPLSLNQLLNYLKKLTAVQLLLFSIAVSVAMSELIVVGMGMLLKGEVTYDYLLTGFVASLFVTALIAGFLTYFFNHQKKNDAALHLQSSITANAAEGVVLTRATDGEIIYTNRRFDEMLGYAPGELVSQNISVIHMATDVPLEETTTQIMQSLEKDGVWFGEVLNRKKDGTTFWTSAHISTIEDSEYGSLWVTYQSDITERKQIELEREQYFRLFNTASDLMCLADPLGCFIKVNPAFMEILGYAESELLSKPFIDFIHPEDQQATREEMARQLERGFSFNFENRYICKDGSVRYLSWRAYYDKENSLTYATATDITERKIAETEVMVYANYDHLTRLPNRRLFHDRLEQEIRKAHRDNCLVALLFIDLDRFKEVNDTLGHEVGDLLLIEAASRIKHCVRDSDTLARLGGDEFTVIVPELHDASDIGRVAQEIIHRLSEPFTINELGCFVSASIGIALYPDDGTSVTELIKNADQAMYSAKSDGRSRFHFFTKTMQESSELRMRLANDLRYALESNQFELYYQPIVDLDTGHIRKAEALLRWKSPEHGFVSPAEFIPIAEDTGTIHDIGDWVFMQATEQVKHWRSGLHQDFQISINKSAVQFMGDERNHNRWFERLREMELPGNSVVVEITESLLMVNNTNITDKLLRFHDADIQVAIDDFGTGYSSLSYLKKFEIDYLKIDQSFTRNLAPDAPDFALCEAIVVMAHKLGLKVIAEGVETEDQHGLLRQIGCDYGQGYLFSRPVPAREFEEYLARD